MSKIVISNRFELLHRRTVFWRHLAAFAQKRMGFKNPIRRVVWALYQKHSDAFFNEYLESRKSR